MEEFKKTLETSEKMRPSTIRNYVARLGFVEKSFGMPIDEIDLGDWKNVIKHLEENAKSRESLRAYITAVIKYLRLMLDDAEAEDEYLKYHKSLSEEVKEDNMKNEMTEKQENNYMPFETMREKFIEWYDKNKGKYEFKWDDALFLGNFLLLKAPVRLGNWRNMKVVYIDKTNTKSKLKELSDDTNYLLVVNNRFMFEFIYVFNDYKTSSFLGEINVMVEDERLKEMLMKVALVLDEGEYINNLQQSAQTNKFKRMTKRILGVETSIDGVRHAFISDLYDNKKISAIERRDILTLFGHSYHPSTTDLYYKKTKK
jgi:hypothetical protein